MKFNVEPNESILYDVRHADEHLLVVEKPPHVVTQPGKKHEDDSLLNGLFAAYGPRLQNLGEVRRWGLLHRLDKETSGLVIVALNRQAYDHLRDQFERRLVKKTYWAIVAGVPRPSQSVIQKPIAQVAGSRKKAVIKREGKPSITAYRVLQSAGGVSLVEALPKTGRLHQIRIHMAAIGHPVLGDTVYAGRETLPDVARLCLHAAGLSFIHPQTGHRLVVRSPWPRDLRKTLKRFGLADPSPLGRG